MGEASNPNVYETTSTSEATSPNVYDMSSTSEKAIYDTNPATEVSADTSTSYANYVSTSTTLPPYTSADEVDISPGYSELTNTTEDLQIANSTSSNYKSDDIYIK